MVANPIHHKEKKVAVISGFTGYLGLEVAKMLAEEGYSIVGLYYNTKAEDAEALLKTLPGEGHFTYKCVLNDEDEVNKLLSTIEATSGVPQVCIHAAWSKPKRKQLLNTSVDEVMGHLDDNLRNSFIFLSEVARYFKEHNEGVLIGITTSGVIDTKDAKGLGGYIPAKYALQGVLASFREELATTNVRVYSVAPSFMEEGMNSEIPKAFVEIMKARSKSHSLTTAVDVARIIVDLCSNTSQQKDGFTFLVAPNPEVI